MEREAVKKNKLFMLILTRHRLWGTILVPYIISRQSDEKYSKLYECLAPFPTIDTMGTLSPEEREVVKIINEYSDRNLYKLFSKDKTVKDFIEKVTPEKIDDFIRPYIERRLNKCLVIARDESIPIAYQKTKTATIHPEDILVFEEESAKPVFRFVRSSEQTTYNLSLEASGRKINMPDSSMEILCSAPCVIRKDHTILFVAEIDGSKIRPFLKKESIIIPRKSEVKYFKTFVLGAVNNFKVEGTGFSIEIIEPSKEAILEAQAGLNGSPQLLLKFSYQGISIFASEPTTSFTIFENSSDTFIFRKFERDYNWEKRCSDTLGALGFFSDDDVHFSPFNEERSSRNELYPLIERINSSYRELKSAGFIIKSRLDRNYSFRPVDIEMSTELINDWFDLRASVVIGEWKIPFVKFRRNILNGEREYILPDGSIAILPETWFTRYRNIFELGKTSDDSIRIHKQHFSILPDSPADKARSGFERLQKLLDPGEVPVVPKPAGLECSLRQYQAEGLNWLKFLQTSRLGGCLADDMGLGKTIQALALLQHNKEALSPEINEAISLQELFSPSRKMLTSLLIVPASLIYNWENEIRRFVPGMKVYSHKGNQRRKSASYFSNFDIIISSYHTVRQDVELIKSFKFHYIILDESQVIKNPASMLYRTVTSLSSDYKLVLTGTPVENSLTDLWTQLNFVNPGLLGELSYFRREFARPIEKLGDDEKEAGLRKIIKPFILRRTKAMVASDLPPVTEQTVFCDMTEEQSKIYDEEKSAVRNSIMKNIAAAGVEKSAIVVLQGLMKLRQISNHPAMTYDDYTSGSGKFETVMQDIENVISEGHKILVFSSFVRHLDLFATGFNRKRLKYALLTGASTNRERIVNSFQDDPETKIFLISLKAGGVGLNLTAADYVFILDPWWNPASEIQALNRAHRIGQDKSVFVYRYITSNSIEEKICRLQEKKSKLADTFITSNNPLKDINIDEILDIIS